MRTYSQQKAALTRAANTHDRQKVLTEVKRTLAEWITGYWIMNKRGDVARDHGYAGVWPDDWSRWQRVLDDEYPVFQAPSLDELACEMQAAIVRVVTELTTEPLR